MYIATSSPHEFGPGWKKASRSILTGFGVLWAVLSMASCVSSPSEPFSKADGPTPNKALIYLYRPSLGSVGFMYDITLSANGKPIVSLPHNNYYPYLANPGEIEFVSKIALGSSESLTLYAKGGHTYFLRTEMRAGTLYGQAILALAEQSTAEEEIRDCRKVKEENIVL